MMNYAFHYQRLVTRAKGRSKKNGVFERHHILPKCMGGTDDKSNMALLTPEEHYVAHQLLVRMYPTVRGLAFACIMMTSNRWGYRGNNKLYGWLRKKNSQDVTEAQLGRKASQATKDKMSASQLGKSKPKPDGFVPWNKGLTKQTCPRLKGNTKPNSPDAYQKMWATRRANITKVSG